MYLFNAKFLSENNVDNLIYKSFPRFYNTVGSDELIITYFF